MFYGIRQIQTGLCRGITSTSKADFYCSRKKSNAISISGHNPIRLPCRDRGFVVEGRALPLIMSQAVYTAGNFGIFCEGSDQLLLSVYSGSCPDVKAQKLI